MGAYPFGHPGHPDRGMFTWFHVTGCHYFPADSGKEVVQLYINDKISSVTTPVKELKGCEKVSLFPRETKRVYFRVPSQELGLWNRNMQYVVEPGEFEVMIGSSSVDIRLNDSIHINREKELTNTKLLIIDIQKLWIINWQY